MAEDKNVMLLKAIQLAVMAHGMQLDKGDNLYILHPLHVMDQMNSIDEKVVAVLHDVIEDTQAIIFSSTCIAGIIFEGEYYHFPDYIISAIDAITKRKGEPNKEYWTRVAHNELAASVKFQDMAHNSSEERLSVLSPSEAEYLREKYKKARDFILHEMIAFDKLKRSYNV